jgi:histidine triad (HIT) family protein
MFNHAPGGYVCPFCVAIAGIENERTLARSDDIIFRREKATAFISSHWWPHNPGHVLVMPNEHFENLYDLPNEYGHAIHDAAKEIALAMKIAYQCDGVSTRQRNEPGGCQDVWHYHLHVFPRYPNDRLYALHEKRAFVEQNIRKGYARKLREQLKSKA